MTAKEYLSQYRLLKIKIEHRKSELAEFRDSLTSAGINLGEEKVQTSAQDSLCRSVVQLLYMEAEIKEDIENLVSFKHRILTEIHSLDNPLFVKILFMRYVEMKSLWDISEEIHYAYRHVKRIHGWALKEFGEKVLKK